MSASCFYISKL